MSKTLSIVVPISDELDFAQMRNEAQGMALSEAKRAGKVLSIEYVETMRSADRFSGMNLSLFRAEIADA